MTKKERISNARKFYNMFMFSNCNKAAVVIKHVESSNPNINRIQFWAVPSTVAFMEGPVIIAESKLGVQGAFTEFLDSINPVRPSLNYFDNNFNDRLKKHYRTLDHHVSAVLDYAELGKVIADTDDEYLLLTSGRIIEFEM